MPKPAAHQGYFQRYIDMVGENDLTTAFANQAVHIEPFLSTISEEQSAYAYAAGKWTIKEMLQHIIDTERIFCYRALCFARGEQANLPGFDENEFANKSFANSRQWASLVEEFISVRKSTEALFKSFSNESLSVSGTANNNAMSAESAGFIIAGHYYHHKKILAERYL